MTNYNLNNFFNTHINFFNDLPGKTHQILSEEKIYDWKNEHIIEIINKPKKEPGSPRITTTLKFELSQVRGDIHGYLSCLQYVGNLRLPCLTDDVNISLSQEYTENDIVGRFTKIWKVWDLDINALNSGRKYIEKISRFRSHAQGVIWK